MDLYQAAILEEDIDQDHRGALDDAKRTEMEPFSHDNPHNASKPSPQQNADVPMPVTTVEIIAAQKMDDFCQRVFAKMSQYKLYFFEGEDGVLLRGNPSISELEQILLLETPRPKFLHLAHHTQMEGHPGRTQMFTHL